METNIPGAYYTTRGSSTTINPNTQQGSSTQVNPNASNPNATLVNPNASNSSGTTVNPHAQAAGGSRGNYQLGSIPIGTVIDGKYQIMAPMSTSGAEAKLYIGASIDTREELCIKLYLDSEHVRSTVRDALLGISHRNIANLITWGYWSGMIYEVWTLYRGQNLQQLIARRPLSEIQINGYLRQMNAALHVLHDAGLVHQDIKPSNFMVMTDGAVVLIDFGVSATKDEEDRTHVTVVGHTTDYSPPEVLYTQFCWSASDYYSLGITLYEMLYGTTPYASYDEKMTMKKLDEIRMAEPPHLGTFSEKIQHLIKGLLQYDKDKRWGYEAVEAWLAGDYGRYRIPDYPDNGAPYGSVGSRSKKNDATCEFAGKSFYVPSQMPELILHMATQWGRGVNQMDTDGRLVLLRNALEKVQGTGELWEICNETIKTGPKDLHYFQKLYRLYPQMSIFAWRGHTYENAEGLGNAILSALWTHAVGKKIQQPKPSFESFGSPVSQKIEALTYDELKDIFNWHVASQYLGYIGDRPLAVQIYALENRLANITNEVPAPNSSARKNAIDRVYYKIGYALSKSSKLFLAGKTYNNKDSFVNEVNRIIESCKNSKNNDEFINFCRLIYNSEMDPGFSAWAETLGMSDEVAKLERALKGR